MVPGAAVFLLVVQQGSGGRGPYIDRAYTAGCDFRCSRLHQCAHWFAVALRLLPAARAITNRDPAIFLIQKSKGEGERKPGNPEMGTPVFLCADD